MKSKQALISNQIKQNNDIKTRYYEGLCNLKTGLKIHEKPNGCKN